MARSRRRFAFALGIGAAGGGALLVACAGIIGLDDFHKGECAGARCDGSADTFVPDAPVDGNGGDAGDGGADTGPGTQPVSWAEWVMPNYEAGTADVENAPSYATAAGSVKDTTTGLTWLQPTPPTGAALTYDAAKAFCESQPGGYRLPKRIELVTLLDFGRPSGAALVGQAFAGTPSSAHWTSSEVRPFSPTDPMRQYWSVNFDDGSVKPKQFDSVLAVKCVKGGS